MWGSQLEDFENNAMGGISGFLFDCTDGVFEMVFKMREKRSRFIGGLGQHRFDRLQ